MADLIDRQAALKELAVYIHLVDKTMGKGILTDDDCMEAAKSVLGEDELPAVQPDLSEYSDKLWKSAYERGKAEAQDEIIRCKDCRFNDGTAYCVFHFRFVKGEDFCSWAERRTDG